MRLTKYFMIAIAASTLLAVSSVSAKNKQAKIYAYGFAASFNDSVVYLTDIQPIDSAWLEERTNFLVSRDNYTYQLREYLENKGVEHRTCIITYAMTRKNIEKKYIALRKKYVGKGNFDVKYINYTDFQFRSIVPLEKNEETQSKAEKKKEQHKQYPQTGPKQGGSGNGRGLEGRQRDNGNGMPPM